MKEKIKKTFNSKSVKLIGIPFLLLFLWFGLTVHYIYTFDTALTVISYVHDQESFIENNDFRKLKSGDKVVGSFVASDNNLGIVSIRFKTYTRPIFDKEDTLVFRIKEAGASDWLVENEYMNGLMYDEQPFPFGFPLIPDSKGKTYAFEIESLRGTEENAIALGDKNQILFTKYKVDRAELIEDKKLFFSFGFKKFYKSFSTNSVRFYSFVYLLPLIFYLIWISRIGYRIKKNIKKQNKKEAKSKFDFELFIKALPYYPFHIVLFFVIFVDIFIVSYNNDILYLVIAAIWLFVSRAYNQNSRYSFYISLLFLIFVPIFIEFKFDFLAEKIAIWSYIFLSVGAIQIFLQMRQRKSN